MTFLPYRRAALALALLYSSVACLAQAADGERGQKMAAELQKRFAAADANGDGRLTKDEAKGKMPFVYKHFDEIDTAHAGSVGMADIVAFARTKKGQKAPAP
jgi:Ca2+-binding EF-hand superfamily protein